MALVNHTNLWRAYRYIRLNSGRVSSNQIKLSLAFAIESYPDWHNKLL